MICEGDSDVVFFRTLLDTMSENVRVPDVKFFQFGGKDRIASVSSALRVLDVPVVTIVDLDILSDRAKFRELFSALGGSADDIDADLRTIVASVGKRKGQLTGAELAVELKRTASEIEGNIEVPKEVRNRIVRLAQDASNWKRVKEDGYRAFTEAPAIQAFHRLDEASRQIGLLMIPEGELEGFCRPISRTNKREWLNSVLLRDLRLDPSLEEARSFANVFRATIQSAVRFAK